MSEYVKKVNEIIKSLCLSKNSIKTGKIDKYDFEILKNCLNIIESESDLSMKEINTIYKKLGYDILVYKSK